MKVSFTLTSMAFTMCDGEKQTTAMRMRIFYLFFTYLYAGRMRKVTYFRLVAIMCISIGYLMVGGGNHQKDMECSPCVEAEARAAPVSADLQHLR